MSGPAAQNSARRFLRKLSHGVAGARTGAVEAATVEALTPAQVDKALDQALAAIERETGKPLDAASRAELARLLGEDGRRAIEELKQAGVNASLTPPQEDALEAIIEQGGSRPTVPVSDDGAIDVSDERLGQWQSVAKKFEREISVIASAVGRIDVDGRHAGTGFVVKEGVILTNRHVLQVLAGPDEAGAWTFRGQPTITFDADPAKTRARQFPIRKKVVLAGAEHIDPFAIDFNKLDFAILECEVEGTAWFPTPLPLESDPDKVTVGRPIFTIGYPAPPPHGAYSSEVLNRLFSHRYGVKRFSPGEIDRGMGSGADAIGETAFAHDATTLGGNSGSCVVDFGNDGRLVVGLHFAGAPKLANYAHANARLRATFGELGFTWKDWIQTS
jgi:serine protease